MRKVVIYIRVRNENPNQLAQEQLSTCRQFAIRKGFNVIHIYQDVYSPPEPKVRTGWQDLLTDSNTLDYDYVIITDFDRIARNIDLFTNYLNQLKHNGKEIICAGGDCMT